MTKTYSALLALLLCVPLAQAATVTAEISTPDTTVTPNTGGSFTPVVGDLLVVATHCPGTAVATAQVTSSIGGNTFTQVADAVRSTNDRLFWHVADQLIASGEDIAQTVSLSIPSDECTGSIITVYAVAGMTQVGASAIRTVTATPNVAETSEGTSGANPVTTFPNATLTDNVTLGAVVRLGLLTFTEPVGWTEGFDTQLDDAGDSTMESAYRNSGFTGTVMTWGNTAGNVYAAASIELDTSGAASPPTLDTFALDDCDVNSCIFDIEPSAEADIHWAAYTTGASAPADCAAVEAASGAEESGTEIDVTGADTVDIPSVQVQQDYYACAENGDGESDVSSVLNQNRDARTGFAIVTLSSVAATSIFDTDSYYDPDVALDIVEYEDDTNESADCNVSFEVDGDFELTPVAPGDCDNRQTFEYRLQDTSDGTGEFVAPAALATGDDTVAVNDPAVECDIDFGSILWFTDDPIDPVDLDDFCIHPLGDTLDYTSTGDAIPTGLAETDGELAGTPTVEDESGFDLEFEACNSFGSCDTLTFPTSYITDNEITAPDVVGDTISEALLELGAVRPWLDSGSQILATFEHSDTVAADDIISQNPAAAGTMTAVDPLEIVVSLGEIQDYIIVNGRAVLADGTWVTIHLDDGEAVPVTGIIVNGRAVEPDGRGYIADCPDAEDISTFNRGTAVRADGAVCVTSNSPDLIVNGLGQSSRGELAITMNSPELIVNGIGISSSGVVSVTDL